MPVFGKPVFYVIHRTAYIIAVCVSLTEMDSKSYFWKFGAHSKECRNPHPEYSTRSSDGYGSCNACNISCAYSCGKSSAHCLEWGHGTVWWIFFAEDSSYGCFNSQGEFSNLNKTCADTKIKTDADNTDHSRNAPDKIIHCTVDVFYQLQHIFSPLQQ